MNTFDLQIQSTASDGTHAPAEIVGMSHERGVLTIALTDHDTVAGVVDATSAGVQQGIRVIPGIEMSVEEQGLHILGYGIDCASEKLLAALKESAEGRIAGAKKITENLKNAGFAIEWEDVLREATGAVVARPHLARAVLARPENKEKLGPISTVHDFIEKYLTDDNPNYVRRAHITAADAIALIRGAGGVAIWSHPAIHFYPVRSQSLKATAVPAESGRTSNGVHGDYGGLESMLKELIGWGISGVEVFNPSHTEDDVEFLNGLAGKYNIIRTAGSDFHEAGKRAPDEQGLHSAGFIGDYETYGFSTGDIIEKLDQAMEKSRY